jgi:hypothetical protein
VNSDLALRLLGTVMNWNDDQARNEFAWLRLMSRLKYDTYGDFLAGLRFTECLARWLQQFPIDKRSVAYDFIKRRLVFVSRTELHGLVENFYPRVVRPRLVTDAAAAAGCPEHMVWANASARQHYKLLERRTLFMGLSDGARVDALRRANVGRLSNEQIAVGTQLDNDKWEDLGDELRKDELLAALPESARTFNHIYVLDDFTASGTTLIRKKKEGGEWRGKLYRFWRSITAAREKLGAKFPLSDDVVVHVHHYLATERALKAARERNAEASKELGANWFRSVEFDASTTLTAGAFVDAADEAQFIELADHYYDAVLEDRHAAESGDPNMRRGYAQCSLCVILENNTPNNSLSLLWAETTGTKGHAMRPLFRRRTRHV